MGQSQVRPVEIALIVLTCDWSVTVNSVTAIAADDEHRQLPALLEDVSHPQSFAVDATRLSIFG